MLQTGQQSIGSAKALKREIRAEEVTSDARMVISITIQFSLERTIVPYQTEWRGPWTLWRGFFDAASPWSLNAGGCN
jgi:hypothetical protein